MMALSSKQRDPSKHPWHQIELAKGGLFKDIKQIPFDPKVDVPHKVCFNCWEYGHSRQYCKLPDRQDHCRNCGRIGVKLKTCPRCSEAYLNFWKTKDPQNKIKGIILELAKVRKVEKWSKSDDKIGCLHNQDVEPIPFDPALDIPYKLCNDCWKPRHPGSCNFRNHVHCFNCGRIGVYMGTCPRCSRAYARYCERKIKDGIKATAPMVDKNLQIVKEPETTSSKPSAFKSIPPAPMGTRSFSSVLQNKDKECTSQIASFSNESNTKQQEIPLRFSQASLASQHVIIPDRTTFVKPNNTHKLTRDYFGDFKILMTSIRHLSISNQNTIVLHFINERQALIEKYKCQRKTF